MSDHDRRSRDQDNEYRYDDDFDPALDELWPLRPTISPGKRTLTQGLTPVQRSAAPAPVADERDVHRVAAAGLSGGGAPLPHLETIQQSFGHHDVSGVRAHVGGQAADAAGAIGARAYATGDDVAFAQAPDLHLAAHEAAHIVQQRGGVRLSGGVGRSGDEYERHADAVADRVVRGESAQPLLDQMAHRGPAGGPAVQRDDEEEGAAAPARPRGEPLRPVTLRPRQFVVTEDYDPLADQVERWIAGAVSSRTEVPAPGGGTAPIRREQTLVDSSNLSEIHLRLLLGGAPPRRPVTFVARLIPGEGGHRYERIEFSTPGRALPDVPIEDEQPEPRGDDGGGENPDPSPEDQGDGGGQQPVQVPEGATLPSTRRRDEIVDVIADNADDIVLETVGFISAGVLGTLASIAAAALTAYTIATELAELADNSGQIRDGAKGFGLAFQSHRIAEYAFRQSTGGTNRARDAYMTWLRGSGNSAHGRLRNRILGGMGTLNAQCTRAMQSLDAARNGGNQDGDGRQFASERELADYLVANSGGGAIVGIHKERYHNAYKGSGSFIGGTPRLRG